MNSFDNQNNSNNIEPQSQIPFANTNNYSSLLDQLKSLQEQKQQLFQKLAPFLSQNPLPEQSLPEINCFTTTQNQNHEINFQQNSEINEKNQYKEFDTLENEEILSDGPIEAHSFEIQTQNSEKLSKNTKKISKQRKITHSKLNKKKVSKQRNLQKFLGANKNNQNDVYGNNETDKSDKSDNSLENFERIHWINQHANIIEIMFSESQEKLELLAKQKSQQ